MFVQRLWGKPAILCGKQRGRRVNRNRHTIRQGPASAQRLILNGDCVHSQRLFRNWRWGIEERTCRAIQVRVMRAPHQVPGADAAVIHRVVGKSQLHAAIQVRRHVIHAATFFVFFRAAPVGRVEHDAIARFQRSDFVRRSGLQGHAAIVNSGDRADMDTPMARAATLYNFLMVDPSNEMRAQAPGVNLFQFQLLMRRDRQSSAGPRVVNRLAVRPGSERDVIGSLIAALNLQTPHAGFDDPGKMMQRR